MEENFLLLFRFNNPLDSSVEFMKAGLTIIPVITDSFHQLWYQYDTDGSGFIEADELKVNLLPYFQQKFETQNLKATD